MRAPSVRRVLLAALLALSAGLGIVALLLMLAVSFTLWGFLKRARWL